MSSVSQPTPASQGTGAAPRAGKRGSLYELVHARRKRRNTQLWVAFGVSVAVHVVALVFFAGMRFGVSPVESRVIQIRTDLIEDYRAPEEVTRRSVVSLQEQPSASERGAELAQALDSGPGDVDVMGADALDLGGLEFDLGRGGSSPTDWQDRAGADLAGRVRAEGGHDFRSALDGLAEPIIRGVARGNLLVVILFDGTRGFEREREVMSAQLERTFNELRFAITERQERRLNWALVRFGEEPLTIVNPTSDVRRVQQGMVAMPYDMSGKENVVKALRYCISNMAGRNHRTIVVMLTDEEGDDIELDKEVPEGQKSALQQIVEECQAANMTVFSLGRETFFQRATMTWTFVDEDGERRRGFQRFGYATRHPELPHESRGVYVARNRMPSGFGAYSLSMIAHRTGGQFFIVSDQPARYDSRDLEPYEPEWIYPNQYDARTAAAEGRQVLLDIAREFHHGVGSGSFRRSGPWHEQREFWEARGRFVAEKLAWCDESIRKLLRAQNRMGRWAPKRWEANYDLTLASLYKMRFMLLQYRLGIRALMRHRPPAPERPTDPDRSDWIVWYGLGPVSPGDGSVEFQGGREEVAAYDRAINAMEYVAKKHAGTPWGARAQEELRTLTPLSVRSYYAAPIERLERVDM